MQRRVRVVLGTSVMIAELHLFGSVCASGVPADHESRSDLPHRIRPYATLVEGPDGVLYGTTYWGGPGVYRINKDGSGFRGIASIAQPYGEVVFGPDGGFMALQSSTRFLDSIGTAPISDHSTAPGGTRWRRRPACLPALGCSNSAFYGNEPWRHGRQRSRLQGQPRWFRLRPSYTEFLGSGSDDGADERSGLAWGSDGALYGVTLAEVSRGRRRAQRRRTIFRIGRDGGGYSVLYRFLGAALVTSSSPHARMLEGSDGSTVRNYPFGGIVFTDTIHGRVATVENLRSRKMVVATR